MATTPAMRFFICKFDGILAVHIGLDNIGGILAAGVGSLHTIWLWQLAHPCSQLPPAEEKKTIPITEEKRSNTENKIKTKVQDPNNMSEMCAETHGKGLRPINLSCILDCRIQH